MNVISWKSGCSLDKMSFLCSDVTVEAFLLSCSGSQVYYCSTLKKCHVGFSFMALVSNRCTNRLVGCNSVTHTSTHTHTDIYSTNLGTCTQLQKLRRPRGSIGVCFCYAGFQLPTESYCLVLALLYTVTKVTFKSTQVEYNYREVTEYGRVLHIQLFNSKMTFSRSKLMLRQCSVCYLRLFSFHI